jgi:hypothetical protein
MDALAERRGLVGEGKLGAVLGEPLGDPPSDRVIVRDPHYQAAFATHRTGRHLIAPASDGLSRYNAV